MTGSEFRLPDLGSGQQDADIIEWYVQIGELVTKGDPLCSVETAKSVIDVPAPLSGVLEAIVGPVGTTVAVGELLAVIVPQTVSGAGPTVARPPDITSLASGEVVRENRPGRGVATSSDSDRLSATGAESGTELTDHHGARRQLATPLARRAARTLGVDIAAVRGSGANGRITLADIEAASTETAALVAGRDGSGGAGGQPGESRLARTDKSVRMTRLRREIAAHLQGRWQDVPHVTCHLDADVTDCLRARKVLGAKLGAGVPLDAIFISACVPALLRFPEMNARVDGQELVYREYYDIGFAIATEDGLLVPVIRAADTHSHRELISEVGALRRKAVQRRLAPDDQGAQTFTVSNVGAAGGGHVTQILPAGTTAILSFGRAREEPVLRGGELASAWIMPVSGTFDHRAVDGAPMISFMQAVIDELERFPAQGDAGVGRRAFEE